MMTFDEAARLVRLQNRLAGATHYAIQKGSMHKSSEGAVSLEYQLPAIFSDDQAPYWSVQAYSYVLNPNGRIGTWTGSTAAEAISKAEDAIGQWCMIVEMDRFGEAMGLADEDPDYDWQVTKREHSSDDADPEFKPDAEDIPW